MLDDFAVLIITYGRANSVRTYSSLRSQGYTGPIYLVCDDSDDMLPAYLDRYGDQVVIFNKAEAAKGVDMGDNLPGIDVGVIPRNESFRIARELGYQYFLSVDDDYRSWEHTFSSEYHYLGRPVKNLDRLFESVLRFLVSSGVDCVAFSQTGDFIGGQASSGGAKVWASRKVMNTFFLNSNNPFPFLGRMNDDVSSYVVNGQRGRVFLTLYQERINQMQTQSLSGGMTDAYQRTGTYQKSFYSVMFAPSCVQISLMGCIELRLHHRVSWRNAVPCIIRESHRKASR